MERCAERYTGDKGVDRSVAERVKKKAVSKRCGEEKELEGRKSRAVRKTQR